MLNCDEVINVLRQCCDLPDSRSQYKGRTIYEAGKGTLLKPSGHYFIDYASFAGGSDQEVPLAVICELEQRGIIVKAFPDVPDIRAWRLKDQYLEAR